MGGYHNPLVGTTPHRKTIAADLVTVTDYNGLGTFDNPIIATPATANATNLYSRGRAAKNVTGLSAGDQLKVNGQAQYVRVVADGVKTVWDETEIPSLVNLVDVGTQATLDGAPRERLRNVVLANGIVLLQKGNDATLAGADFKVVNNGGTLELHVEKTGGGAFGFGTCIDVHMDKNDDAIRDYAYGAGLQGVPQDAVGATFWTADNDIVIDDDCV